MDITFHLVIRKHQTAIYEWGLALGAENIDGDVEEDMVSCLRGAGACFGDGSPVRVAVTYRGTQVGTYWPGRLQNDAAAVADGIVEMLEIRV